MKEKKVVTVAQGSLVYTIMIFLVFFLACSKNWTTSFHLNNAVQTAFVKAGRELAFDKLHTVGDWWSWSEGPLMDALYWDTWYNGHETHLDKVSHKLIKCSFYSLMRKSYR